MWSILSDKSPVGQNQKQNSIQRADGNLKARSTQEAEIALIK